MGSGTHRTGISIWQTQPREEIMTEIERITDQLERAFRGEAWHGPSVRQILSGVNYATANTLPMKGVHTIWEIVLHMIVWMRLTVRALDGESMAANPPPDQDWPEVEEANEDAWAETLDELVEIHNTLSDKVSNLTDDDLIKFVPGRDFTWYFLIHGIVQHNLYHAGQIAIIKSSLLKRN